MNAFVAGTAPDYRRTIQAERLAHRLVWLEGTCNWQPDHKGCRIGRRAWARYQRRLARHEERRLDHLHRAAAPDAREARMGEEA